MNDRRAPAPHHKAPAGQGRRGRGQRHDPAPAARKPGAQAPVQPWRGWTVVLRRQPARLVDGEPHGGYADAFELICCDCGDNPDLGYRDVSPELQQIRGPYYPIMAGITAYEKHVRYHWRQPAHPGEPAAKRASS
jgi:hypothetical protein